MFAKERTNFSPSIKKLTIAKSDIFLIVYYKYNQLKHFKYCVTSKIPKDWLSMSFTCCVVSPALMNFLTNVKDVEVVSTTEQDAGGKELSRYISLTCNLHCKTCC